VPCEAPIRAYQKGEGGPLAFHLPNTNREAATWRALDIPCGICILCRQEQARQWAVRISHEAQMHEESCFITLTYDEKNLPEWGGLEYDHLVKFWKKMRKQLGRKLRYFAVGEYGDASLRPHYHACVFGHAFKEGSTIVQDRPQLWVSPVLAGLWGHGQHRIGALTFETAQYTASYVLKKMQKKQQYVRVDEESGELIPLEQPRSFMSKNLGKEWWRLYGRHVSAHDLVVINGRIQKPPKAYDRWLEKERPDFIVAPGGVTWRGGEQGKRRLKEIKERREKQSTTSTPQEGRARAENTRARIRSKSRKV